LRRPVKQKKVSRLDKEAIVQVSPLPEANVKQWFQFVLQNVPRLDGISFISAGEMQSPYLTNLTRDQREALGGPS
jgi:hypothetical protein